MPASPPHRSSSPLRSGSLAALLLLSASACVLLPDGGGCSSRGGQGSGCARVEGRVLDAAGEPISGAVVSLGAPHHASYDFPVSNTQGSGRFFLEINRMMPTPADTVTMWLRATLPFRPGAIPADSVQVHLHIAPVGEEPETVHQDVVITEP